MPFTTTNSLIDALRDHLAAQPLDPAAPAGEKLFHRVGYFGANRMADAMRAVFAAEQRVCFIVPGGDSYDSQLDVRRLLSKRTTRIALLIGDRALDAAKEAALVGMLTLKDRAIHELVEQPAAGLAFEPGDGEPLVIESQDKSACNLGRECWLQWLSIPAGSARASL